MHARYLRSVILLEASYLRSELFLNLRYLGRMLSLKLRYMRIQALDFLLVLLGCSA